MSLGVLPGKKASLGSGFPPRDQWPEPYPVCLEKLRLMGKAGSSLALPALGCDLGNGPHNQAGEEPPPWSDVFFKDTDELVRQKFLELETGQSSRLLGWPLSF